MESNDLVGKEMAIADATLWARVKSQCLDTNPFIKTDDQGREVIICPRCAAEQLSMDYTTFAVEARAMAWAVTVQKCPNCHHIFAFVR